MKTIAISFRTRIRRTWLAVVMLGCVVLLMPGALRADQFDTLRIYWQNQLTGTNLSASTLTSYASIATNYWSTMNTNAGRTNLWSDLPMGSAYHSANFDSTFGRLQSMAVAWATAGCPLQGNTSLAVAITNGLDWMCANVYTTTATEYDNWWDWEIGGLQAFNNAVVLIYPALTGAQITNYNNSVDYFSPSNYGGRNGIAPNNGWMTGANLTDQSKGVLIRAIIGKNSGKMAYGQTNLSPVFLYVTNSDGFYRDGSFVQHTKLAYTGGYGSVLLGDVAQLVNLLNGSTWQITDPNLTNVYNWVVNSYEPLIYHGAMMDMVRGRGISRYSSPESSVGSSVISDVLQIGQFAPPATGTAFTNWANSLAEPPSQYQFADMDRVVAWRSNFCLGLSMSSSRIANYESINGENLHGWFTGDGMTYLYLGNPDTQFTGDFWPTVDAYHLPGTTVVTNARADSANEATTTGQPWVGGAQVANTYGTAGMSLAAVSTTLTAKKSWFMFNNEIVCLGAGITCGGATEVDTTVEDRRLGTSPNNNFTVNGATNPPVMGWSSNLTSATWCALDGVAGYYFPGGATNLRAAFVTNTGAWIQINNGTYVGATTNLYTDAYLTLWFNHGIKPTNASYAYVILPNYTAGGMAAYAASPDIVVLTNSATLQAASKPGLGVVAANFWVDGTNSADLITANKKSAVITLETAPGISVGIADPTQTNSGTVSVTLNRSAVLTAAADPGVTVVQLSPQIILSVNVNSSLGKTYQASFLYSPVTMTWDADTTTSGAQDGSGNWDNPGTNWWDGASDISWSDTIASIAAFGAGGPAGTVTLTNAHTAFALAFNPVGSGTYTLAGTGLLTVSNGITVNASATVGVPLNLPASQTWTVASNQTLNVTGTISAPGAVALSLAGGGTLTLSGPNTNNGPVTVNAGTLLVNGNSLACTNTVTVSSNAIFGGTGTNGGSVILNAGGQLAPGGLSSIGTLTLTNNLTLNGSTLFFALATNTPATNDLVAVGNRLTVNGANSVILSVISMIPAGNYTLMTFAATNGTGTFALGGSLTNNATLQLNATNLVLQVGAGGIYVFTDTWKGYTNGTWNTSVLNWTNGSPIVPYQNNDAVIFDDTLVKNSIISNTTPGAVVTPGSMTFNNNLTNYLIKANIGGTNLLIKNGTATVALTGTNTYAGNTTINGGTLVVTNGGTINSPLATLNIGAQGGTAGTLTLSNSTSAITVQTLLATNVICGGPTNSIFNFNGGTLTTSNNNGLAASILLASNVSWNVNGNWSMNAGTNLIVNSATNGNPAANVYLGNGMNNLQINVNPNAVLWLAIPTNSFATNILSLVIGNGNATNNVVTVNNGTLIATNYVGTTDPIVVGNSAGSTGNQLIITNGGQVSTICYGAGSPISGTIGNYGNNNSLIVAGTNGAGLKAMWNFGGDRLNVGNSSTSNSWVRVQQGGVITNAVFFGYYNTSSLIITNGGQMFADGCVIGRDGLNSYLVVAGADAAGNPATLAFPTAGTLTIGGGTGTPTSPAPGTNTVALVSVGGLVTNAGSINVGQDTNSVRNTLVITNGGQVFSTGNSAIGYVAGCNSNSVTVGGGTNSSLWNLGSSTLTIGNSAGASNNYATVFSGGVLTNVDSVILGGASSRLNFNGGTLAADGNGNLIATNGTAVYPTNYVQAGGAIINDNGFTVTSQLPMLQDPNSPGGGLTKIGSGSLTLPGSNTYTGPTFIGSGTLALSGSGSIAGSTNITVAGGATFDVSALSIPFSLGISQTLSNSTVGAVLAGTNDCSSGTVSLVYDGTNASFSIVSGTLTLSTNTVFNLNLTGPTLARGGYDIIYGGAGLVTGMAPTNVTYTGASMSGTPSLQIVNGGLYLDVGGIMSGISYGPTTFAYNGSAQSPTITFTGSTGARTTNYVGIGATSYASVNAPTNVGIYYVSNSIVGDANYFGTANSTVFIINPVATVSFSATNTGLVLNPSFCGLSYEKNKLTGGLFAATNVSLISMFGQIAPAVLRIGGNSVDTTCWGGLSGLPAITTAQVDAFAGFIKALPTNWHVIYGINMSVNNATNCAAEAAYVANALGSSLLGFEIGNECDLYYNNGIRPSNYTYAQFLAEWRALAAAITNAVPGWAATNGGNGWTLTGPVSADNTAGYTKPFATNEASVISMVTQHYYRANSTNVGSTMSLLLSPDPTLPGTVSNLTAAATANHLPLGFRMDECGSFYNGGNAVSASYGASLWTLDYMFTLALNGCQGINFHGGGGGNTYTPIADNGTTVIQARPEFYGLKLFSLASVGGSVVHATNTVATNFNFTAYGVRQGPGVLGAILNNKETNYSVQVTINLGSNVLAASSMALTGPTLSSTNGYTLGGATINPDGSWTGGIQSVTLATNGQVIVTVPPITALWLNPVTEGTNTLLANDAAGTSSFTGATNWSDGMAPHIFASYFTSTNLLRTPATGSGLTFAGDSLTIGPSSPGNTSFRFAFNAPGGACTVNNGILAGGIIDAGVANATNYLSGTNWLVTTPSGFGLGGDNTRAIVLTNLNMSGTFALSNGVNGGGSGTMIYAGNAANFTGPLVTSAGTTLQAYSQTNLGGNPASFNAAQFVLDNGSFQPLASLALTNANSGVTLNPGGGTFNVASGLMLSIGNPITGPGSLTNQGGGTLVLSSTNTYTGNTMINAGTLLVNGNASISNSSNITVAGGAIFNVSGLSNAFALGGSQTLSNSAVGAILNGTNNCNSGTISLLYDGSYPSFIMTNGGMKLSASTLFNVNNTSSAFGAGSYVIITNTAAGTAGLVAGTAPSTVNLRGNTFANTTAGLQINNNRLYLVIKTNQSISFASGTSLTKTYGNAPFADTATANSGLTATYSSDNPAVATVDSSGNVTIVGAGSCHILADQSGNGTYNAAPEASQLLTINPGTSSVSYGSTTFTYNGSAHSPTISITGLSTGNKTTNYVRTGATSYSSVNAPTNAGSYALTNTVLSDANNYGTTNGVTFTIGQVTTMMNLFSSAQTNGYRASVFFTATNLPGAATSNVVFQANGVSFSTNVVANGGTTSLSTTNLPRGTTNIIVAIYNGDNNYLSYSTNLIQTVTNHPPTVSLMYVTNTRGMDTLIALADLATNWSDGDVDAITLTSISLVTTTGRNLSTNRTWILYTNAPNVNDQFTYSISDGQGGTNTGYVNMVLNTNPFAGQASINLGGGVGNIIATFYGVPGYGYTVQRTLILSPATWVDVSNYPSSYTTTNPVMRFTDTNSPTAYYRLKYSP